MAQAGGKKHGIAQYVVVALILAAITYVEYYIVEFPPAFMSSGWILFWLIALSVVKFLMVIWFFMHLKDDDKLYTGFFSSGLVIGMGIFIAVAFMFLLPRAVAPVVSGDEAPAAEAHGAAAAESVAHANGLPEEVVANIVSDGASRPLAQQAGTPRPADLTLVVTPPPARTDGFEVRLDDPIAAVADTAPVPAADADEPGPGADAETAATTPGFDEALGAQVYASNCVACHQAGGAGLPGVFPPLAGHMADLFSATGGPGGRSYLVDVLLYGLQGPIEVAGTPYNGAMPAWPQLSDEQIAAVINHQVAGGGAGGEAPVSFDPVRPEEVAGQRGRELSATEVHALRADLGPIPPTPTDAAAPADGVATETAPDAEPEPAAEPEPEPAAEPEPEPAAEPEPEPVTEAETDPETADAEAVAEAEADPTFDRDLGTQVYASNCAACHQLNGAGLPGVFPPLAGHAADLYQADGGRDYLVEVMLYGLQGQISVGGTNYSGLMPAWAHLGDEQIAAVINHTITGFDDDAPDGFDAIRAEEVAARRGEGLTAAQILESRGALGLE